MLAVCGYRRLWKTRLFILVNCSFFMAFIDEILQKPSYGWMDAQGVFLKPTVSQLFREAFSRINIFRTRKNWIALISWFMAACMLPMFIIFILNFLTWKTAIVLVVYAMVIMSTHGTIWFHRYCTHKSYKFSHPFWRLITQNLVIKTFLKRFMWFHIMCTT